MRAVARAKYEVAATAAARRVRAAVPAMDLAFAAFEPRTHSRAKALRFISAEAVQLRRLARNGVATPVLFDSFIAAAEGANSLFRPAKLQSYVDVSVRVAALRAFAAHAAPEPLFGGDSINVTAALLQHAPDNRAVILAHAELLLDRERPDEALPLVRRALRIQAVCQTAQQLLARAEAGSGSEYDLSDKFCHVPFTYLSTSFSGDAFACCCPAWVPFPVANVIEAPSGEAVWNSPGTQEVRRSILDGDFKYCSRTLCSYIAARTLPRKSEVVDPDQRRYIAERTVVVSERPKLVEMNHDQSCNLACPSCRTGIVTASRDEQKVYVDAADRVLLPLMREMEGLAYISGGGEAFASAHYKKILSSLNRRDYPRLNVFLLSNGQLLNAKRWAEFPELPEMIGVLSISIDAARAETYERLRRPGKWNVLMENLEEMARMRAAGTIRRFHINFVVQAANFREIPEFIEMGTRLGVDSFWLQRLTNYGAYSEPVFEEADVTSPQHPDHAELLTILRQGYANDPRIDMDMLLPILPEFVQADAAHAALSARRHSDTAGAAGA